jgi:hypothetical protein
MFLPIVGNDGHCHASDRNNKIELRCAKRSEIDHHRKKLCYADANAFLAKQVRERASDIPECQV